MYWYGRMNESIYHCKSVTKGVSKRYTSIRRKMTLGEMSEMQKKENNNNKKKTEENNKYA